MDDRTGNKQDSNIITAYLNLRDLLKRLHTIVKKEMDTSFDPVGILSNLNKKCEQLDRYSKDNLVGNLGIRKKVKGKMGGKKKKENILRDILNRKPDDKKKKALLRQLTYYAEVVLDENMDLDAYKETREGESIICRSTDEYNVVFSLLGAAEPAEPAEPAAEPAAEPSSRAKQKGQAEGPSSRASRRKGC
jgi:hypothetical protein